MAESLVQVTSGSGPKLHTWQRTIGANNVEDEFVVPGEYPLASYFMDAPAVSIATANDHVLQIMAGSSLNVRIRRIRIYQQASISAVNARTFHILRLSSAGTGGTAITGSKLNTADAASGATGMTLPTAKGTETTVLMGPSLVLRQALLTTASQWELPWEWTQHPGMEPIIIPAGTANGIAIKTLNANTSATLSINVEYVETSFV